MQKAKFPHMLWAKAHAKDPAPIELGFSGAGRPAGPSYKEFVTGDPLIEGRIAQCYGVPQGHVYLTGGTSLANFVTIAAFAGRGAKVAVERPRYTPLSEIPKGLGARMTDLRRNRDGALPAIPRETELVIVSSPHNPTGRLLADTDWRRLERFASGGGIVIVDEIYRDLQAKPPRVAAARHARFLTTGGVTKAYGLGALRMGWVLGDPELLRKVAQVNDLVAVQCSTPSILALRRVWDRLPEFRRKAMRPIKRNLATLRRSGMPFIEPQAGLTVFVEVSDGDRCMAEMARRGVGVASGSFFGDNNYVRLFLGAETKTFRDGVRLLAEWRAETG